MDFISVLPSAPLVLPLFVDTVAAGFPSPAQGYEQHGIDLNELLVRNAPATFLVRAKGDSMVDAGIHNDDLLVVDFSVEPHHGDIVIAKLDDSFTVKRLYQRNGVVRLYAENKAANYPPIVPGDEQTLEVIGVVRHVIHSLHA